MRINTLYYLKGHAELENLRLQALRGIDLYEYESVIIFNEVQLFPKARPSEAQSAQPTSRERPKIN